MDHTHNTHSSIHWPFSRMMNDCYIIVNIQPQLALFKCSSMTCCLIQIYHLNMWSSLLIDWSATPLVWCFNWGSFNVCDNDAKMHQRLYHINHYTSLRQHKLTGTVICHVLYMHNNWCMLQALVSKYLCDLRLCILHSAAAVVLLCKCHILQSPH